MSDRKLGKELNISHTSFERWRRKFADAPRGHDKAEWRAFIRQRGLHCHSSRRNAPPLPTDQLVSPETHTVQLPAVFADATWEERNCVLWETLEFVKLHAAKTEPAEMRATLEAIAALAVSWKLRHFGEPAAFVSKAMELIALSVLAGRGTKKCL